MRITLRRSYSNQQSTRRVEGEDMMSAGETGIERGAVGVYPDGGRSIWLLGMLVTFKALSEETGGEYSLYELTVPPQLGALPHIHHAQTEAFYVLEGEVEFLKGEHTLRAGVGEFVFIPRGVVHGFKNLGQEPARFLGIDTPGGLAEKLLTNLGEPAKAETLPPPPEGPPDVERIAEIVSKYDTKMVLSPEQ
jgi:mannose-6-phosphate isomerase-like protein (cupin superfamily)